MAVSAEMRTRIEARINEGLRNLWYPVAKSVEIRRERPYGTQVLGDRIVLWRDEYGAI